MKFDKFNFENFILLQLTSANFTDHFTHFLKIHTLHTFLFNEIMDMSKNQRIKLIIPQTIVSHI